MSVPVVFRPLPARPLAASSLPRALAVLVGCCVAATIGAELLLPRAPTAAAVLSLGYHWLYGATVVLCLLAARGTTCPREALAWRAMALGTASILASIALLYLTGAAAAGPQWGGDLLALLYYPAACTALLALAPPPESAAQRMRRVLDLAVGGAAVTTLVAHAWVGRAGEYASPKTWMVVYAMLTPAAVFLVLLPAVYLALSFGRGRTHPAHVGLLAAVVVSAVTDALTVAGLGARLPRLAVFGWTLAVALLGGAAYLRCGAGRAAPRFGRARRAQVRAVRLLPYGAVTAAVVALVVEVSRSGDLPVRILSFGLTAVLALLMARQVVIGRENRELLDAQRAHDARFRVLVQRSSDALLIVDPGGRIDYHSESLARVLGMAEGAATAGGTVAELFAAADRPLLEEALQRAAASPAHEPPVVVARPAGDLARTVEVLVSNRLDDDAIAGMVLTLRDVTERLALEAQLWQSQKLEAVGRLAGGVAHDFSSVLTAILTGAELAEAALRSGGTPLEEMREIRGAAVRAGALTRQLLSFARPQAVQPAMIAPSMTLAGLDRMLGRLLGGDVELAMSVDPESWCVLLGPGQLEQVIVNLATNARDAMPHGGRLTIHVGNAELPAGAHLVVTVSDTGAGMDDETRARIFEPFFTTKEAGKGTGLGLATVYGIVRHAGGRIAVESAPGAGTTFRVYLPRVSEERGAGRNGLLSYGTAAS